MANKFEITTVKGWEVLDCRGYPTLQVDVWVNNAVLGRADVPCGRSNHYNGWTKTRCFPLSLGDLLVSYYPLACPD